MKVYSYLKQAIQRICKPCALAVTGIDGEIPVKFTQTEKGIAKRGGVASVEVVSAVSVGEDGVACDQDIAAEQTDRAL